MLCLPLKLKNHIYKLFISAAVFGFVQSSYTVGEDNGSVQVCMHLKQEKLGAELTLKLQTHIIGERQMVTLICVCMYLYLEVPSIATS